MKRTSMSIGRRRLLKTTAAGAAVYLAAPPIIGRAAADDLVVVNTWGGQWEVSAKKHLFDPFTAATGIRVETISPVSFAKLVAQATTKTYDFDVSTANGTSMIQAATAGVLEPFDPSIINPADFPKESIVESGIASHAFGNNIVYRTDKFPNGGPESWAEFWDVKKFPGPRSFNQNPFLAMVAALVADGADKTKLYPIDTKRAYRKLDEIKPHIRVWWKSGAQSTQLIQDGEVSIIEMWDSVAKPAIARGVPLKIVKNEALLDYVFWFVSKGTPRAKNAWKFVKFATSAEPLAGFCNEGGYGPMNPESLKFVKDDIRREMVTQPDYLKQAIYWPDIRHTGPNMTEWTKEFERWLAS